MAVVVGSLVRYRCANQDQVLWDGTGIGVVTGFVDRGRATYAVVYYGDKYPDEEERAEDLETMEVLNESR